MSDWTVVVPDATRPLDYAAVLRPLLAKLNGEVTVRVGLGLHRPMTTAELAPLVAVCAEMRAKLDQHDPHVPRAFGDRVVAVGVVEPCTIDRINILRASKLAMLHAVHDLCVRPDVLLLDAVILEDLEMPQIPLIGGDRRSISIAAASVVAKVYRDLLMESYHERYPVYDFKHKRGYATEGHQAALRVYGPSPIHRKSFEGVDEPMLLFGEQEEDGCSTR